MSNIKDYLDWRGDVTLNYSHFNEVDNLIFSELVFYNLKNIVTKKKIKLGEALNTYLEKNQKKEILSEFILSEDPIPFLEALKDSKRFKDLKIFNYINITSKKETKQFSALSIELNYNTIYIAFKGTDNNLFGWKEDFNLCFMSEIPSQLEAVKYVNNIKRKYKNIIIGGHSKGGNLAIYAAVKCKEKIKKRIKYVYNNDGPGFLEEFTSSPNYLKILPKIISIVPETSIIGMLLTHQGEYKVIKSSTQGIWQHDPLSWQVINNSFITIKEVDETSNKINNMLNEWLRKITKQERELFINTLFQILEKNKIETIAELSQMSLIKIPSLVKSFKNLDEESRKLMINLLKDLVKEAKKNFNTKTLFKGIKLLVKKS